MVAMKQFTVCLVLTAAMVASCAAFDLQQLQNSRSAAMARHHQGRAGARGPLRHLDVALPDNALASEEETLLHLKEQAMWDKENTMTGGPHSKAAILPSNLKELYTDKEFNNDAVEDNPNSADHAVVKLIEHAKKIDVIHDLEDLFTDDEVGQNIKNGHPAKAELFFNLKDAFKKYLATHSDEESEGQSEGQSAGRLRTRDHPGVFFNLDDLEAQMKEVFSNRPTEDTDENKNDLEEVNKMSGGVFFSVVELLKQYIEDADKHEVENNDDNDITIQEEITTEDKRIIADNNERMFEELQRSNISVTGVDADGGILFSLADKFPEQVEENQADA